MLDTARLGSGAATPLEPTARIRPQRRSRMPGRIATDRVTELDQAAAKRRGTTLEDIRLESRKTIPARRYGEPAEFGAAAAFLCSAPASYITGVALRCDGGLIRSL